MAAGISGYTTNQQFQYIIKDKDLINKISPDLIIFGYVDNDLERQTENYESVDKRIQNNDFLGLDEIKFGKLIKEKVPNLYRKFSIAMTEKYVNNVKFNDYFGYNNNLWIHITSSGKSLRAFEYGTIIPMKEYIETELGVPFFFVASDYPKRPALGKVKKVVEENDIKFYPIYEVYNSTDIQYVDKTQNKINPVNSHPSVAYCQLHAKLLLKILKENYSEFLGKPTGTYRAQFIINDWMPYCLKPYKMNDNTYKFTYPALNQENAFLRLPIERDYIKLNLEDPLNISKITIIPQTFELIDEIDIYINSINEELGYDDQVMTKLERIGESFSWKINSNIKVTSINVAAKIKYGLQQDLYININQPE